MNPNDIQYGGSHYKKTTMQHWDMLPALGYGWEYYVGCATKYLTRVKDPTVDPAKAGHFVDKLISLIDAGLAPEKFRPTSGAGAIDANVIVMYVTNYLAANNIPESSTHGRAIMTLMLATSRKDLCFARSIIREVEAMPVPSNTVIVPPAGDDADDGSEPNSGYTNQDGSGI